MFRASCSMKLPELPEVQTVVSDLKRKIVGDTITDFWSDWPKAIKNLSLQKFKQEVKNRKILGVRRIGKNIFVNLSGGKTLYIHLKMTGHLLVKSSKLKVQSSKNYFDDKVNQYVHHSWELKDKERKIKKLDFSDMRKFAKIVLADTQKISELPEIKKLGPDAMSPQLTLKKFKEKFSAQGGSARGGKEILSAKGWKKIGVLLMNQEVIAGIGNIYRSEILFEAGLMPMKMVKDLKESEWRKLHVAMKKVLKKAIKMRGTSESDYRDTSGASGSFQKALRVYKKNGERCVNCGIIVRCQILDQRSLFFCPQCQK
ncbi:bifunctional DNA-formamidopyrimidine glycosylase/DNA-(apurinic or apyrimidinic site) lyase [Patescibacteria group bacterium]|nr:bifunctional DNA-formamidopyrimidine glycosylase/DNA-(apurinic or apyrimidinic site) lyase [Patescibacteria group bacterium]